MQNVLEFPKMYMYKLYKCEMWVQQNTFVTLYLHVSYADIFKVTWDAECKENKSCIVHKTDQLKRYHFRSRMSFLAPGLGRV